jgi:phosphoribosyl-ATP pyrophosphohydrolase
MPNPGYHLSDIPKGVYGEASKIVEEALEAADADKQGVKVMVLVELSDLVGCIIAYLKNKHPETSIQDLIQMADVTRRAFASGHRKEPEDRIPEVPMTDPKLIALVDGVKAERKSRPKRRSSNYDPPGCRDWG